MELVSKNYTFVKKEPQYDRFQFEFDISLGTWEEQLQIQLKKTIGQYENFCIEQVEAVDADAGGADITVTVGKIVLDNAEQDVFMELFSETGASVNINILDYPIFGRDFKEKLSVKVEGTTGRIVLVLTVSYF